MRREWDAGLICVCLSKQPSDWQAIQLSGSEKERNTIITSIISHSARFCCQTLSLLSKWALYFYCYSFICYDWPAPTWKTNALWQISKEQWLGPNTPHRSEKMPELWNECPCRPAWCMRTLNSTWRSKHAVLKTTHYFPYLHSELPPWPHKADFGLLHKIVCSPLNDGNRNRHPRFTQVASS